MLNYEKVKCHTYTSLNVLIVIKLSVWWFYLISVFFFSLEMHKILYFWHCKESINVCCFQAGGSHEFGTFVTWKHVLYRFMLWPKQNTLAAQVYIDILTSAGIANTMPRPHLLLLIADAVLFSVFLIYSYNSYNVICTDFQLFALNGTRPSAVQNSEWQLSDQVAGCHRDWTFVLYLQLTAQQALDAYKPQFNKSHHVFNPPFCQSMVTHSRVVSCTVQTFSFTR